jgi:hypothetical protein
VCVSKLLVVRHVDISVVWAFSDLRPACVRAILHFVTLRGQQLSIPILSFAFSFLYLSSSIHIASALRPSFCQCHCELSRPAIRQTIKLLSQSLLCRANHGEEPREATISTTSSEDGVVRFVAARKNLDRPHPRREGWAPECITTTLKTDDHYCQLSTAEAKCFSYTQLLWTVKCRPCSILSQET